MKLNQLLATGGMAVVLCCGTSSLLAQDAPAAGGNQGGGGRQGRGNFDPAQFQQRMMDRTKEQLEIKDDAEWKAIEPLVKKVMDARTATMRGMFGRRGGPGGGGPGGNGGGASNPEQEALQKAIDAKASGAELKTALAKFIEARKGKQGDLEKAQAELRKVLTPRQEAIASLNGLL